MGLESTIVCVDNSEYMRNGDFMPTRLQAEQDAINLICQSKTRSNPENNVGLITLTTGEVLVTLTSDAGSVMAKLHQVQPAGFIDFSTGIRVAHLVLKHRLSKNHKMRIVAFVGSPVTVDEKELQKLAKRLKKEKVSVDIVNFGEDTANNDLLSPFIDTLNGKEGSSSHFVTIPSGGQANLADALLTSPIIQGEDGAGAVGIGSVDEFGVDPNTDPELALALRVSMEEQRARQESEARRLAGEGGAPVAAGPVSGGADSGKTADEQELERALAMSMDPGGGASDEHQETVSGVSSRRNVDLGAMTEEEQIAYALQMSLQQQGDDEAMDVDAEPDKVDDEEEEDVVDDVEFLQDVLGGLPGVNPESDAVKQAIAQTTKTKEETGKEESEKGEEEVEKKKQKKEGSKK